MAWAGTHNCGCRLCLSQVPFADGGPDPDGFHLERVAAMLRMYLSQEKDRLDAEYARLPPGGGRNAAARRHKAAVEGRLEELNVQMSSLRTRLRAQPLGPM